MKIKTLVEFTWEVPTLPKDNRLEIAKKRIRDDIRDKIINDMNAYYQDDVVASMVEIDIKRWGI